MGLCSDCDQEGETVSYIGASKADVVGDEKHSDEHRPEESDTEDGTEISEEEGKVCDLCKERYIPE